MKHDAPTPTTKTNDPVIEAKRRAIDLRRCSGAFRTMEDKGAAMVVMTNGADFLDQMAELIIQARRVLS